MVRDMPPPPVLTHQQDPPGEPSPVSRGGPDTRGLTENVNGQLETFAATGVAVVNNDKERCPHCDVLYDLRSNSKHRKVTEPCGHEKCRQCFLSSEDGCTECATGAIDAACANGATSSTTSLQESSKKELAIGVNGNANLKPSSSLGSANDREENGSSLHPDAFRGHYQKLEDAGESLFPRLNYIGHRTTSNYVPTYGKSFMAVVGGDSPQGLVDDGRMPSTSFATSTVTSSEVLDEEEEIQAMEVEAASKSEDPHPGNKTSAAMTDDTDGDTEEDRSDKSEDEEDPENDNLDHIEVLEGSPPVYHCKICGNKFKTKAQTNYHKYCKGGDKPFKCIHCKKGFISRGHFEDHVKKHNGELPHPCPNCPRRFVNLSAMKRHLRTHTGGPRYACDQCESSFTSAQTLKEHKLTHTGERPFACTYCKKTFHRRSIFKKHLRTHTGERPYTCATCGSSFAQKWTYGLHLITHTDQLPYSCEECDRKFSTHRNLLRHAYLHKNERKYTCEFCGGSFKRKDNLDRHIKTMHEGKVTEELKTDDKEKTDKPTKPSKNGKLPRKKSKVSKVKRSKIKPGTPTKTGMPPPSSSTSAAVKKIKGKKDKLASLARKTSALMEKYKFLFSDPQRLLEFLSRKHISDAIRHAAISHAASKGMDLLVSDLNGNTIAHKLSQVLTTHQFHELVKLMKDLDMTEIFTVQNLLGQTAIHIALEKIRVVPSTLRLLNQPFNWNARDLNGNSLLHVAVASSQSDKILKRIVKSGGDWTLYNLEGSSVLHLAVQTGNVEAVEFFLSLGADVNCTDLRHESPLHRARLLEPHKFIEMIGALTKHGADMNAVEANGNNLVHVALVDGRSVGELEFLVKSGVDWSTKNFSGQSVLHMAAVGGDVEVLKYFVGLGSDVNVRDGDQRTPLHWAAFSNENFSEMIRLLVDKGADMNAVEREGNNMLQLATYSGRSREELEELLHLGCSWKALNENGQTVLHMAAEIGNVEAVKYFISLGADANWRSLNGETPLHRVHLVKEKFNETLRILVENGADINAVDNQGNNIAHRAVIAGRSSEDLQCILQLGCHWQAKTKCGHSVLHSAAQTGHYQAMQYFISLGADVNVTDNFGVAPMVQLAFAKQFFAETLKILFENGGDVNSAGTDGNTLLLLSAKLGGRSKEDYDLMENLGGDPRAINKNGQSVLHLAAQTGNMEALEHFTFWGADVNGRDVCGRTPLHCIEMENEKFMESVKFLVESGADINARCNDGRSFLHIAAVSGRTKYELEQIVEYGGDWRATMDSGQSLLHILVEVGNPDAIKYFIALGADPNGTNNFAETPLHRIRFNQENFMETVNALVENGGDVNATDQNGNNVIMVATAAGRSVEELKHLVNLGVNLSSKNKFGQTVFDAAVEGGNSDTLKYFASLGIRVAVENGGDMYML